MIARIREENAGLVKRQDLLNRTSNRQSCSEQAARNRQKHRISPACDRHTCLQKPKNNYPRNNRYSLTICLTDTFDNAVPAH